MYIHEFTGELIERSHNDWAFLSLLVYIEMMLLPIYPIKYILQAELGSNPKEFLQEEGRVKIHPMETDIS